MRYSQLFGKTRKEAPSKSESINHRLLTKAGFIDQLMTGSYTFLPLGWRVEQKIEQIIREEMDKTGACEILMPLLHPKNIWNETGRWEKAADVMYQFKKDDREYALSFTHEEIVMDLVRKNLQSVRDLPIKIYHFSTKFRNEPRAKSGILRLREFIMKDLYSVHKDEEDLMKYYWEVKDAYIKIFKRLGLEAILTEASGGVFTTGHTHEFQVLSAVGEDTIYLCADCGWAINQEIFNAKRGELVCKKCKAGKLNAQKSVEVGNIFPLGTFYSEKMGVYFTDHDGTKKPVWYGSYGIGLSRLVGTLVEIYHDEKGLAWPESVAPFKVCLVSIANDESQIKNKAEQIYQTLQEQGIEILYDDRDVSAGEKFADCDLIGIPYRLVVSEKTGENIEIKKRLENKTNLLPLAKIIEIVS